MAETEVTRRTRQPVRGERMRSRRGGARRSHYFRHTPGAGRRAPAKAQGAAVSELELLCGSG